MNFDDIRAYNNEEVPLAIERLSNQKQFINLLSTVFPLLPKEILKQKLLSIKTTEEFQQTLALPFLNYLEENKTKGIEFRGIETIDKKKPYLYISNHRDIVMDPSLLCKIMLDNGMATVGIAIGDNLMIYSWIEDFVRINNGFLVKRGLNHKQALEASKELSAYIRHLINDDHRSVWIAQREGRAKDSNDVTQDALLRMLSLSGEKKFIENFSEFNICPLCISYEYDPTDYLKAKEFQQKRDNSEYKKTQKDDLVNMQIGGFGYKGKVVYTVSGDINDKLTKIAAMSDNFRDQISLLAKEIDNRIHSNYVIFNINKIAYDLLHYKNKLFTSEYTDTERSDFEHYISKQIAKIEIENKDSLYLREKMLEMYANPLINKMKATNP